MYFYFLCTYISVSVITVSPGTVTMLYLRKKNSIYFGHLIHSQEYKLILKRGLLLSYIHSDMWGDLGRVGKYTIFRQKYIIFTQKNIIFRQKLTAGVKFNYQKYKSSIKITSSVLDG